MGKEFKGENSYLWGNYGDIVFNSYGNFVIHHYFIRLAGNFATLNKFDYAVRVMWFRWFNRRSQRKSFNYVGFTDLLDLLLSGPGSSFFLDMNPALYMMISEVVMENVMPIRIRHRDKNAVAG